MNQLRLTLAMGVAAMGLLASQVSAVAFKVGGTAANPAYDTYWAPGTEPIPTPEPFYKADIQKDGSSKEEGTWAPYFTTTWGDFKDGEIDEPMKATITWDLGFTFALTGIWLKAATGEWYAVDLNDFTVPPVTSIELFNPNTQQAISHVMIYGTKTTVPDGGLTAAMLGIGMLGLGLFRRKLRG